MSQAGFWDWEECQAKLMQKKDLLARLNQIVPWEAFRPTLEQIIINPARAMQDANLLMWW